MRTMFVSSLNSCVDVNTAGPLSTHLLNDLQSNGLSFKNHDNNRFLRSNSSNHAAPRTIANIFACMTMNRVIERGRKFLSENPDKNLYIIDIGAKYAKHANLYYKALAQYAQRVYYIAVRPQEDDYDRQYIEEHRFTKYPRYD